MKLRDWIDPNKLDWCELSRNPNAIRLIEKELNDTKQPTYIEYFYNLLINRTEIKRKRERILWLFLCFNPNAIPIIEKNLDKLDKKCWEMLSKNDNAIDLLKKNMSKISWSRLFWNRNPRKFEIIKENIKLVLNNELLLYYLLTDKSKEVVDILKQYPDYINWSFISSNPYAIDLLKENQKKICWFNLSRNPSPEAIKLLEQNPENIDWWQLSLNSSPEAIKLLKENPENINWDWFSSNSNPEAIKLLKENPENIHWNSLLINKNPATTELLKNNIEKIDTFCLMLYPYAYKLFEKNKEYFYNLVDNYGENIAHVDERHKWVSKLNDPDYIIYLEKHQEKINWKYISSYPGIFVYDYPRIMEYFHNLNKEFIVWYYHPSRIDRWIEKEIY
jgi:hypothetical protein